MLLVTTVRITLKGKEKKAKKISYDLFFTVTNSQNKFCWVRTKEKARILNYFQRDDTSFCTHREGNHLKRKEHFI